MQPTNSATKNACSLCERSHDPLGRRARPRSRTTTQERTHPTPALTPGFFEQLETLQGAVDGFSCRKPISATASPTPPLVTLPKNRGVAIKPTAATIACYHEPVSLQNQALPFQLHSTHELPSQPGHSVEHTSALWQCYLEKVDPFLKIIDTSRIQHLFTSSISPKDVPKNLQSLKSAILYAAATSMQQPLGTACPISDALMKTHARELEDCLAESRFLAQPTILALQALTIYLACGRFLDKTYAWSLTAILVRLAMALKLHRDPESLPFSEREYRRRLWWHICTLDAHTAETSNTDPLIYERQCTTRVPEWSTDPRCPAYFKDMFYSAVRSEITYYSRTIIFSDQFMLNNGYPVLPRDGKICIIEALADSLKEKYFKRCDRSLPTYTLALTSSRIAIAKLKLVVLYQENEPASYMNNEVDQILGACVEVMEGLRRLRADPEMSSFAWLWQSYADWEAAEICLSVLTRKLQFSSETRSRAHCATESFFDSWADCLFEPSRQEQWTRLNHLRQQADVPQPISRSKWKSRQSKVYTLADSPDQSQRSSPPIEDARRSMTLPVDFASFCTNNRRRKKSGYERKDLNHNSSLPFTPKGDEMHFDINTPELHSTEDSE